jgi:hypothetical protein
MSGVEPPTINPSSTPAERDRREQQNPGAGEGSFAAALDAQSRPDGGVADGRDVAATAHGVGLQQKLVTESLWRRAETAPGSASVARESRKKQTGSAPTVAAGQPLPEATNETGRVIGANIDLAAIAANQLRTPASPPEAARPSEAKSSGGESGQGGNARHGSSDAQGSEPRSGPTAPPAHVTDQSSAVAPPDASTAAGQSGATAASGDRQHGESAQGAKASQGSGPAAVGAAGSTGAAAASGVVSASAAATGKNSGDGAASDRPAAAQFPKADAAALLRGLALRSTPTKATAAPSGTSIFQAEHEGFSSLIGRGLAAAMRQRDGVVTIQLRPDSLGHLKIRIGIEDGTVSARFQASTPQARDLLKENLDTLRTALEARGLQVDRLHVEIGGRTDPALRQDGATDHRNGPNGDRQPSGQEGQSSPHGSGGGSAGGGGGASGGSGREGWFGPAGANEAHGGAGERGDMDRIAESVPPGPGVWSDAHGAGGVSTILRLDTIA